MDPAELRALADAKIVIAQGQCSAKVSVELQRAQQALDALQLGDFAAVEQQLRRLEALYPSA